MKLRFDRVTKSYGERKIFDELTFEIPAGQRCVLLGASGAGKSQILKHLVGLIRPDSGSIYLEDQDISKLSESQLAKHRQRFGFIFQNGGLLESMSVGENVALPLLEHGSHSRKEAQDLAKERLKMVGLEDRFDQTPATLSGGQRKRVAIARALVSNVEAFLFDEPTAGLDPMTAETIDDVIIQVNEETNATTVVVTHDLISVGEVAERILILDKGKIYFDGTPDEFKSSTDERVLKFLSRELEKGFSI